MSRCILMNVREVVKVPEDSPDAKKWPHLEQDNEAISGSSGTTAPSTPPAPNPDPTTVNDTSSDVAAQKRPGPRKPKISLAAVPTSKPKAKKITTLDKSAMDWRAHVNTQADPTVKDELEANRRAGGYLERVEFLDRVDLRKQEVMEANKGGKRRRG